MATYGTFSFPTTFSGDTLDAQTFTVTRDGTALPNLASVEVEFRPNKTGSCSVDLSLTNGNGITIINATTWNFRVDAIAELDLDPGYYVCSFKFTDTQGRVKNYLRGNLTVLQPETRD
jgi:hypothetical protein